MALSTRPPFLVPKILQKKIKFLHTSYFHIICLVYTQEFHHVMNKSSLTNGVGVAFQISLD